MDEQDRALFRQADARRAAPAARAPPRSRAPPAPQATRPLYPRGPPAVLQESLAGTPRRSSPWRNPATRCCSAAQAISESVFRQLRRGQYRVDGEIDLHG